MSEPYPYDIKAIPTVYGGTRFRSRLEARWAAFFDLRELHWEYEPIDFDGWAPDFRIKPAGHEIFVEVKPFDLSHNDYDTEVEEAMCAAREKYYAKAIAHHKKVWVMLLGIAPPSWHPELVGFLYDHPTGRAGSWAWTEVFQAMAGNPDENKHVSDLWRRAGNRVQWLRD